MRALTSPSAATQAGPVSLSLLETHSIQREGISLCDFAKDFKISATKPLV